MYTFFITVAVVSLILAILSILFDIDGLLDFGDGLLVAITLSAFTFGGFGLIFTHMEISLPMVIVFSAVFASFVAVLVVFLMKKFKGLNDHEMNTFQSLEESIGERATIVWWSNDSNEGQARVILSGKPEVFAATSQSQYSTNDTAVISDVTEEQVLILK